MIAEWMSGGKARGVLGDNSQDIGGRGSNSKCDLIQLSKDAQLNGNKCNSLLQ